ncbi:MAG: hypothetical protein ACJ72H_15915 [Candidatus Sulfotelmatobacter sp.]
MHQAVAWDGYALTRSNMRGIAMPERKAARLALVGKRICQGEGAVDVRNDNEQKKKPPVKAAPNHFQPKYKRVGKIKVVALPVLE